MNNKKFLITGGAGFIGSAVIRHIISCTDHFVVNADKLTYAGNPRALDSVAENSNYFFERVDICNNIEIRRLFSEYRPDVVLHLAAESHVDRSINRPDDFIQTNIVGTYVLLEEARKYWVSLTNDEKENFRFHHVSTDEVYGDLGIEDEPFTEKSPYSPSSPYSAAKASADHLVRAWYRTFGLPTLVTNCSNNYGPYQVPEKLIPLVIQNALSGKKIPIYGNGQQTRDWLYVNDHAEALALVALFGKVGETYNIGGNNQKQNIEVVRLICSLLDTMAPSKIKGIEKYEELITHVTDRAGHDVRYAVDASKILRELDWRPKENFESGIYKTVKWYLEHPGSFNQA